MSLPKLELVSFKLCPYVHRAVITLKEKNIPFTFKEIDLYAPPVWFDEISPMGKVPVLVVDGTTALFESAVINDYLDEITEPKLNPKDPLKKALERAWIEYGSELMGLFYETYTAKEASSYEAAEKELFEALQRLEGVVKGPYFRGTDFSLVDTSYAPLFLRMNVFTKIWDHSDWSNMPKTRAWAETLMAHPSVRASCFDGFREGILGWVRTMDSYILR